MHARSLVKLDGMYVGTKLYIVWGESTQGTISRRYSHTSITKNVVNVYLKRISGSVNHYFKILPMVATGLKMLKLKLDYYNFAIHFQVAYKFLTAQIQRKVSGYVKIFIQPVNRMYLKKLKL